MITINGKNMEYTPGMTVEALLSQEGFQSGRVVVELNRQILPKDRYSLTGLQDGDAVEVLEFVGGG
jgi:thiamine biosynthesis protein ThiS